MNVVKIDNLSKVSKLKYLKTQPVLLCAITGKNARSLGEILILMWQSCSTVPQFKVWIICSSGEESQTCFLLADDGIAGKAVM